MRKPPGTTSPRRGRPPTVSEGQILAVAAKQSRGELTMSGVAAELGVTPATLYKYFADKQALLIAVYEAELARRAVPSTDDWRAYMLAIGEGFFEILLECPALLDIGPWIRQTGSGARFVDRAIELLTAAGLPPTTVLDVYAVVEAVAYNRALLASGLLGPVNTARFAAGTRSLIDAVSPRPPIQVLRDQINLLLAGVPAPPDHNRRTPR